MSHFNLKSLTFYGVAIGSVIVLFTVTTRYGEANVKAPPDITGRYPLTEANLPGCLSGTPMVLDIRQSGVYLSAALVEAEATDKVVKAVEQRPPLSGEWDGKEFSLAGPLTHVEGCQETLAIAGTIQDKTMDAALNLGSAPEKVSFTAQKEEPEAEATAQGH